MIINDLTNLKINKVAAFLSSIATLDPHMNPIIQIIDVYL